MELQALDGRLLQVGPGRHARPQKSLKMMWLWQTRLSGFVPCCFGAVCVSTHVWVQAGYAWNIGATGL